MYSLESIEKKQNIKFPEEYKRLYKSNFKEINNRIEIRVRYDVFYLSKFLTTIEINDILAMKGNNTKYDI